MNNDCFRSCSNVNDNIKRYEEHLTIIADKAKYRGNGC